MFVPQSTHFLPPKEHRARRMALWILCLAPFPFGLLALALGQDANWDLRNYHYYNAFAFLNDRYGQDILPSQTPYFYNPLLDVPFYLLATHVPARVAGVALGCVQGFNFLLLFGIAHVALIVPNPRHKIIVCAALSALGILGGGGISQLGTTFGDNITSLGVLLSAALVVRHSERLSFDTPGKAFALALLFGIPVGMMTGLKLPCVIYAVGLCGGLLFASGGWRRCVMLAFAFGLGVLGGIALTLGHWALFLQEHFQSPLFPYFNNIFHAPLAPPTSARDTQYAPHSLSDIFIMPFLFVQSAYRVGEIPLRDLRIPILYPLLPVAIALRLLFGRSRAPGDALAKPYAARYLLASFTLSYVVWLLMFSIYRYAVTLEMIAPLLIVFAIGLLPLKMGTRGLLAGVVLLVIAATIQPGNWTRRAQWLDRFVEADIPALGDTSHLIILMAGFEPYAHLIPEFPPEISFVRIQSNFSSPDQDKGINKLLHARVEAHQAAGGRFMLLIPVWQLGVGAEALSYFHLKLAPENCQNVTDKLFNDTKMSLCRVIPQ